ncbi:MAG: type IX secretion system membrane protein PorP/SprF [Bacteroidota bacterium]
MKIIIPVLFFLLMPAIYVQAQHNPSFSQYMFNDLLINPACAGNRDVLSVTALNRNQWLGFSGAPRTQTVSAHFPVNKKRIGLGFSILNDHQGVEGNTSISLYYSYRIPVGKGKLSAGLSTHMSFLRANWDKVSTTTPYDIVFSEAYRQNMVNIGGGMEFRRKSFFTGISVPYIIDYSDEIIISDSIEFLHTNIMFIAGSTIKLKNEFRLHPSALLKIYPKYSGQLDINILGSYRNSIFTGISLRTSEGIVWLIEYQLTPEFRLGYTHDFPVSVMSGYMRGTNEILLRYEFGYRTNAVSTKFF